MRHSPSTPQSPRASPWQRQDPHRGKQSTPVGACPQSQSGIRGGQRCTAHLREDHANHPNKRRAVPSNISHHADQAVG